MVNPEQPFRLLDLPKELRLMIYERIPITIKHNKFTQRNGTEDTIDRSFRPLYTYTIVSQSIAVSILATNHQVRAEAHRIVAKKLRDVLSGLPKIIVEINDFASLWEYGGLLVPLHGYAFALRRDPAIKFGAHVEQAIQSWTRVRYRDPRFQAYPYHRYQSSVVYNPEVVGDIKKMSQQMAHGPGLMDAEPLRPLEIGIILNDNYPLGDLVREVARTASLKHDQFYNYKFSLRIRFLGLHRSDTVLDHVKWFLWDSIPRPRICEHYMASVRDVVDKREWDRDWAEGARL